MIKCHSVLIVVLYLNYFHVLFVVLNFNYVVFNFCFVFNFVIYSSILFILMLLVLKGGHILNIVLLIISIPFLFLFLLSLNLMLFGLKAHF